MFGDVMKVLVVPDSFKGSLNSVDVAQTIKNAIEQNSEHTVTALPFADGGEGFIEAFCSFTSAQKRYCSCHNIYHNEIEGCIAVLDDVAVVECAVASGIQNRKQVMMSSSYGTGELIKFALDEGCDRIILALGGTGSCDGGAGAISALGGVFYDENYNMISVPKSRDLNFIFGANYRNMPKNISFTYACDVENVLFGKNGASYVFAAQKGANKTQIVELDEGLQRLNAFLPNDVSTVKGAGAAGGICGGLYSIYGGEIRSGFDILAQYSSLEEKIKAADVVITGEGKTDAQTLMGKLPYKISKLCSKYNKKCVVVSGVVESVSLGDLMISLVGDGVTSQQSMESPREILYKKVQNSLEKILQ